MINKIIRFSLDNRLFVMVVSALVIVYGVWSAQKMDVDVFPDLTAPTVTVMTEAHGLAPEEVEKLVSFPIETAVNGSTGIRRVRSSSAQGFSLVWVEFDWGMNIYNARQIVSEKLQALAGQLPDGVGQPILLPQGSIMGEVYIFAMTAEKTPLLQLRTIADWEVRQALLSTSGVAQVTVFSREQKEYQVLLDPGRMAHYGVSLNEVTTVLPGSATNATGGFVEEYGNRYVVRGIMRTNDPDKLGQTVLRTADDGTPVRLVDVAEVKTGAAPFIGEGAYNGNDAVIVLVTKQPNVNTVELTAEIERRLETVKTNLPEDVQIHTDIFKQADFIESSVSNVKRALIEGFVLVVIILVIFLMNIRTSFISLVAIPLSLLVTVIVLKLMGYGINTMVLGGMAIAIGSLVDDAIVDVENVYKRLRQNSLLPHEQQLPKKTVILNAAMEIRSSIINATLIIIAAFIPLFFLSGMEGRMLRPLGLTYIISLFASLVVALTVTSTLESYLLTNDRLLRKHAAGSFLERKLTAGYRRLIEWLLPNRVVILFASVALFVGSMFVLAGFGRSFLPSFNEGTLTITTNTLPGISFEEGSRIGHAVETAMLSVPEIKAVERRTGRAELAEHSAGIEVSELDAPYELSNRPKEEFLADLRAKLSTIQGISFEIGQPMSHRINHMLSGSKATIAIKIFGDDLRKMYKLGKDIEREIKDIPGLVDLVVEQQIDIPQIQIKPRYDMLASYGIPVSELAQFIEVGFGGEKVGTIFEGERSFDLVVRLRDADRNTLEAMREALIDTPDGRKIPLSFVADIRTASGPNTINRENVRRKLVVSANVSDRDVLNVVKDIQSRIKQNIELPKGLQIDYGGQFESEASASKTLLLASVLSLLIIFLLLFQEFRELSTTWIVLLNLPLALIGGVFSISITSGELNIPAIIGFITLFGIATRNGILLVSRYNHLKTDGLKLQQLIVEGSSDRLIPILMTALTAALALIPMVLAGGKPGNEIQSPMAVVILGGLLSSTFLNLVVVPLMFYMKENRQILTHASHEE